MDKKDIEKYKHEMMSLPTLPLVHNKTSSKNSLNRR